MVPPSSQDEALGSYSVSGEAPRSILTNYKNFACNAGHLGSVPGLGGSPGEGIGYPLQYQGKKGGRGRPFNDVSSSFSQEALLGHSDGRTSEDDPAPQNTQARGSLRTREGVGGGGAASVMRNVSVTGVTESHVAVDEPTRGSV